MPPFLRCKNIGEMTDADTELGSMNSLKEVLNEIKYRKRNPWRRNLQRKLSVEEGLT